MSDATSRQQPDLREQLSGSIANTLIHDDELDPEQQPLLRSNTPTANRERFQQNQRTAANGIVQRSGGILLIVAIFVTILFFAWVVFYFAGWNIWREHHKKKCDQPLADWLLTMLLLPVLALIVETCSCKKARLFIVFFTLLVLLLGAQWWHKSKTCDETNPELYEFVRQYLIFLTIWWISWVVMPLIAAAIVIYGMWHGWFDELNGASPETIKHVETVPYDPTLFATESADASRAPPECCICTEHFDQNREIKRTACQHYFHEECLGKWLRVSTTCPLCRNDLEIATLGEAAPSAQQTPAAPPWMPRFALVDVPTEHERAEIEALRRSFPALDDYALLDAIRVAGSAEQAAAFLDS